MFRFRQLTIPVHSISVDSLVVQFLVVWDNVYDICHGYNRNDRWQPDHHLSADCRICRPTIGPQLPNCRATDRQQPPSMLMAVCRLSVQFPESLFFRGAFRAKHWVSHVNFFDKSKPPWWDGILDREGIAFAWGWTPPPKRQARWDKHKPNAHLARLERKLINYFALNGKFGKLTIAI